MGMYNLLDRAIPVFGQTFDVALNGIGKLINGLISWIGIVGVGIIVFSLILKFVVLPFDIYQRISMRKQNQKMKAQKERMEELQKRYANDKDKYNQKLMEMYKESGISLFSSCLPMILSMIIFIVAINAFNAFSQFSNVQNYNTMVGAYNAKIEEFCPDLDTAVYSLDGDKIVVEGAVEDADAYFYYKVVNSQNFDDNTLANDKETLKAFVKNSYQKECWLDYAKASNDTALWEKAKSFYVEDAQKTEEENKEQALYSYFVDEAQNAVVTSYKDTVSERTGFLWIKNIWETDAAHKKPLPTYKDFEAKAKSEEFNVNGEKISYGNIGAKTGTTVYSEEAYELITAKLEGAKTSANGYYILVALSIGTILLQQLVTMRSQKEQQKYSTVDGQGAGQQKMMLIMMTGMFAIFSFMYSAAFSIYMITSNIFSLFSTLIINKLVDKSLEKKEAAAEEVRLDKRGLSRIEAAKQAGKASAQSARDKKSNKDEK